MQALKLPMEDFEDALQAAAAQACGADYIITRNGRDFTKAPAVCAQVLFSLTRTMTPNWGMVRMRIGRYYGPLYLQPELFERVFKRKFGPQ